MKRTVCVYGRARRTVRTDSGVCYTVSVAAAEESMDGVVFVLVPT